MLSWRALSCTDTARIIALQQHAPTQLPPSVSPEADTEGIAAAMSTMPAWRDRVCYTASFAHLPAPLLT